MQHEKTRKKKTSEPFSHTREEKKKHSLGRGQTNGWVNYALDDDVSTDSDSWDDRHEREQVLTIETGPCGKCYRDSNRGQILITDK